MLPPGRPPEPSARPASPPACEVDVSASGPAMLGLPLRQSVDFAASPPRGPLRRFSAQSVHSRQVPKRLSSAPSCHRGSLVPSAWSLSTSTAFSGLTVRALLQLAADPGVHRVSLTRPPAPATPERATGQRDRLRFPRCIHPAKMLPTRSAVPCSLRHPKMSRSRKAGPSMTFHGRHPCRAVLPKGVERHSGVFSPRVRLRGVVPLVGFSPPSTVSSDRRLCPSMGFCTLSSRRYPTLRGLRLVDRFAARSS
jgi:hypothetical protein